MNKRGLRGPYKDKSGNKYNHLNVLSPYQNIKGRWHYLVVCDCGTFKVVSSSSLYTKSTVKSCGICQQEGSSARAKERFTKHGHSRFEYTSPTYHTWKAMRARCKKGKANAKWHGDVGVYVCDEWEPAKGGSFENFLSDMGERPEGCTLNRINCEMVYSKDTCEWATLGVQSFDQKMNHNNSTGVTGVSRERTKWRVRINKDGVNHELGRYLVFEDAVKAREDAELHFYGFILRERREKCQSK